MQEVSIKNKKVIEGVVTFMLYTTTWIDEDANDDEIKRKLSEEALRDFCSGKEEQIKPYKVEITNTRQ